MTDETLRAHIETLWEERDRISSATVGKDRDAIETALEALDSGRLRVAAPQEDGWVVHEWLKKAVLLSFRLNDSIVQPVAQQVLRLTIRCPSSLLAGIRPVLTRPGSAWCRVQLCAALPLLPLGPC